jgi:hypothetical protein
MPTTDTIFGVVEGADVSVNARLVRSSSAHRPIPPRLSRRSRPDLKVLRAAACAAALLGAASLAPSSPDPTPGLAKIVTCSFSNPAYSGFCNETRQLASGVSGRAACLDIVRCLNDVQCTATYCRATQIRSGWKLAAVHRGVWPPAR